MASKKYEGLEKNKNMNCKIVMLFKMCVDYVVVSTTYMWYNYVQKQYIMLWYLFLIIHFIDISKTVNLIIISRQKWKQAGSKEVYYTITITKLNTTIQLINTN